MLTLTRGAGQSIVVGNGIIFVASCRSSHAQILITNINSCKVLEGQATIQYLPDLKGAHVVFERLSKVVCDGVVVMLCGIRFSDSAYKARIGIEAPSIVPVDRFEIYREKSAQTSAS